MGQEKTYVITAAQGMQSPYSAKMYGRDSDKGAPNVPFIKNLEEYVKKNSAELRIHCIPGANCNEIELHPFFKDRKDVYIDSDSRKRNAQNKEKERAKRGKYEKNKAKWIDREESKAEKREETFDVTSADCPYNPPQHYFWDDIPEEDLPVMGERLNSNIRTVNMPLKPQNKNPLAGKNFLTKKFGGNSVIIASPKKFIKPVAKGSSGDYPHLLITTGACTKPNYNFGDLGYIAKEDHSYGFTVVNIIDDKIYLPRIVPAQVNGTFIDLGIKYVKGKSREKAVVSALEIGDSHFVEINPKINKVNQEMMNYLRPESTFMNDVFAALCINTHDSKDPIRQARLHRANLGNLEKELRLTGEYICENADLAKKWGGKVYIKFSNHDDMLYRWLSGEGYRKDKENMLTAHKLLAQDPDRSNCFEKSVRLFCNIPDNVVFLKPGDDESREGYFMSSHGHQGVNGSRGSLKGLEDVYKKIITAHCHTLQQIKEAISAGTSTRIPLDYQLGHPSTSMAGNVAVYRGGLAQAIPIIKSQWAPKEVLSFLR